MVLTTPAVLVRDRGFEIASLLWGADYCRNPVSNVLQWLAIAFRLSDCVLMMYYLGTIAASVSVVSSSFPWYSACFFCHFISWRHISGQQYWI